MNEAKGTGYVFEKFITAIKLHGLVEIGDRVIVAVSGGADSMALLHLLLSVRRHYALDLVVAHLNHNLRGQESEADESFVRSWAAERNLSFVCEKISEEESRQRYGNLESWARNRRYDFLFRTSKNWAAQKIAVGHTQSDQAETLLMRLIRGSGTLGLSAMRPKRDNLIRPLVYLERAEIQEYLRAHRISWREDFTNRDTNFLRNRLRQELIPQLKKSYNPRIVRTLSVTAEVLRDEAEALQHCVDKLFDEEAGFDGQQVVWNVDRLLSYHKALQKSLIRHSLRRLSRGRSPDSKEIAAIVSLLDKGKSGKRFSTTSVRCVRSRQSLVLMRAEKEVSLKSEIFI